MMDELIQKFQSVRSHVSRYPKAYISVAKASGVFLVTLGLLSATPTTIRWSLTISPICCVQIFMIKCSVIYILWKAFLEDIKKTLIHGSRFASEITWKIWNEYLRVDEEGDRWKRISNRRIVRILVMMMMMRSCVQPDFPISALLFFIWYNLGCNALKFRQLEIVDFFASLPFIGQYVPQEHTSAGRPESVNVYQNNVDDDSNSQPNSISKRIRKLFKTNIGKKLLTVIKLIVAHGWVFYFLSYSKLYTFCAYSYASITCSWLENHMIKVMLASEVYGALTSQLEGLEQYYVAGILAIVEMCWTFIFMIWILKIGVPILMLIALYTNVYCTWHDVYTMIIQPAATERAFLSKFSVVPGEDLQEGDDECPICLSKMGIARETTCGHQFHGHCLRQLVLRGTRLCPMCRAEMI